jgi:hypothetical protein
LFAPAKCKAAVRNRALSCPQRRRS